MNYQSFKGRKIDFNKPVMLYKNLHNGLFSVKQGGLVVAHVNNITLTDVKFKVNKAGRERVIKEQKKNVHAFTIGYAVAVNVAPLARVQRAISYNPYKSNRFYFKDDHTLAELKNNALLYCCSVVGLWTL